MVFSSLGDQRTRSMGTCNRSYCCAAPEIGIIHQSRWYLCSHLCYANRVNTRFLIPKQILLVLPSACCWPRLRVSLFVFVVDEPEQEWKCKYTSPSCILVCFQITGLGEQQLFVVICRIYRLVRRSIFRNSFAAVGENSNTATIVR